MRASDTDRQRTADLVKAAYAEGRLDMDEHNERIDQVMAAKTYADLQQLVADLPVGPVPQPQSQPQPQPRVGQLPEPAPLSGQYPVGYPPPRPAVRTEPLAPTALVLGLLGFVTAGFASIPAIITGHVAMHRTSGNKAEGQGMALAGTIMGYIVAIPMTLMVLAMIVFAGV